jgi:hypothetical protein
VTFTRADLRKLRVPIVVAAVLTAVGVGCVAAAEHYLGESRKALQAAKSQREQAQKRVEQVAEEEREIRANLSLYARMEKRGLTNPENRLDLIDSIARIKNDRRLFDMRYSIEPQRAVDYAGVKPAGGMDFVTSRMKLDMFLLHEEDLLDFLDDLSLAGKAYVSVRNCSLSRLVPATQALGIAPRLRSDCVVDLIVIKQVKAS